MSQAKIKKKKPTKKTSVLNKSKKTELTKNSWLTTIQNQPETARRLLLKIIVVALSVLLIIFWLWSWRYTLLNPKEDKKVKQTSEQWQKIVGDWQNSWASVKQFWTKNVNQANTVSTSTETLEKITQQLASTLNLANWQTASSTELNLSLKYPPNWHFRSLPDTLIVSSYDELNADWPVFRAKLEITKQANPKKLTNQQWYQAWRLAAQEPDYTTTTTETTIANLPALTRIIIDSNTTDRDYVAVINLAKGNLMYQFSLFALGDKQIFQNILEEMIQQLNFIN